MFPCSDMESLPCETVLHGLLQHESFPWASILWELLQCVFFPWCALVQELTAPVWVVHRKGDPVRRPALAMTPLHGATVLSEASSYASFPWGNTFLQDESCFSMEPFMVSSRAACVSMGCKEVSVMVHRAVPPPPSYADLGVFSVVSLTYSLFLSQLLNSYLTLSYICKRHYQRRYQHLWLSSGQHQVHLVAGWDCLCPTWGQAMASSH